MENTSNEELIKIYKELYFNYHNNEFSVDYKMLVMTYKMYLSLFFDKESTFYRDIPFLAYVIDGFNYIYRDIFDSRDIDLDIITLSLYDHNSNLKKKRKNISLGKVDFTDSDVILIYTLSIANIVQEMDLVEYFYDEIQRMFFNSCVIESKEKESVKNGMENRKYYS